MKTVELAKPILSRNDQIAAANAQALQSHGILGLNMMASPGAGKTRLILATALHPGLGLRSGVIEGDLATRIDADAIAAQRIPVTQINTDGGCHLEADMIANALSDLPLDEIDVLFVENVGNLVCPANFLLGTNANIVFGSAPEGHDKPYKYPGIYAVADAVVLTKADLIPHLEFDVDAFRSGVRLVNPGAPVFVLSSRTGEGMGAWIDWLRAQHAALDQASNAD